jgi:hypothetical protein
MNTSIRSTDVDIDLSRFDNAVQTETKPRPQFAEIPDGRYDVRIEDVELYKSPSSGNPVLKYTMRVLGPTHADRMMWKRRGITEKTRDYVLDELKVCGLLLDKFSDLKLHLHDLIGVELEVTRKTRGEDVTIFFNDQLESSRAAKREEEDDDLPF